MKSLIPAIVLAIITLNVCGQADTTDKKTSPSEIQRQNRNLNVTPEKGIKNNPDPITGKPEPAKPGPGGYMIQDGKMMVIVDSKLEPMQADTKLSNGTLVMTNGSFIKTNGSKEKLKDGQLLDLNGEVIPRK